MRPAIKLNAMPIRPGSKSDPMPVVAAAADSAAVEPCCLRSIKTSRPMMAGVKITASAKLNSSARMREICKNMPVEMVEPEREKRGTGRPSLAPRR